MIHRGFKLGKKVYVTLKDGTVIVDKFVDSTSKYLKLENNKIFWKDIRCTTINKNRTIIEEDKLNG